MSLAWNIPGAGAGGILTCGMLKRLHELGRKPRMAFAASSGALNLCLYAQGDLDVLEHLWLNIQNKDVKTFNPLNLLNSPPSVYSSKPLLRLLQKHVNLEKLAACGIACYVTSADCDDYTTRRYRIDQPEQQFKTIPEILLASASLPGLFPPVWSTEYDGGLVDNFSIQEAIALGATEIVVLMPNRPTPFVPKDFDDVFEVIAGLPEWATYEHQREVLSLLPESIRPKYTEVTPKTDSRVKLFDFSYKGLDRKKLIALGYELVKETIG